MAAAKRRLNATVHVHQDDGTANIYGPNDDVPAADAKKIGDHAWVEDKSDDK